MVTIKGLILKNKTSGKILISIIFASLAILAIAFTGYLLIQEKKNIISERLELARLQRDLTLLDKILTDQKENEEKIKMITRTLPVSFNEVAFAVAQFERIASTNEQELETKIEEIATPEQNDLLSLQITLKTSGGYSSFSKMLTDLTHLSYHTKIDTLKIEGVGEETDTLVNLRLYLGQKGVE